MAKEQLTPHERIYRLKQEVRQLKDEIRMPGKEHKADLAQLRSKYRAGIKRMLHLVR